MNLLENFTQVLQKLYGNDDEVIKEQLLRYNNLFEKYNSYFNQNEVYLFSTPGRTELGGNHTDHNLGRVIAASINLDSIAIISKNDTNSITIYSEGYKDPFSINLDNLDKIDVEEGTTDSIIRGIAARFVQLGYSIGGFDGVLTSTVLPGSGLSSSASIEILICSIFNNLYNDEKIKNEEIEIISQWAENNYFGKPCGLMDQMACAVGGIISIDFQNQNKPKVEKVIFDFDKENYKLLIVDTGGSHEDLTNDYASIPYEMKRVANFFEKENCREVSYSLLIKKLIELREKVGDRSVLRVLHFFNENERVLNQVEALSKNEFSNFLSNVSASGNSSFKWLQNIYSPSNVHEQGLSLALALSESFIAKHNEGACRVHGGGFAGTIQTYLPENLVEEYKIFLSNLFDDSALKVLTIRNLGSVCLNNL